MVVSALLPFNWMMQVAFRKFFYTASNLAKGVVEFKVLRVKMIFFFVTSFFLWTCMCIIVLSTIDVLNDTSTTDPYLYVAF
jgi:hypothetical protein